ncbi:alpha/beta hydrolase fold domain-containing protein [Streptomyces sp. NPDC048257]|uniref:alpha/beta hydrolase fold domain-containing protein n=1 Tax=Streptomyces sp. NPDC048257 TaxID=3365526 RepID=UPI00371542E4
MAAWQDYRDPGLPVAADGTRLHSTPCEAADLRGLAPAVLPTGDLDPVADDAHRYGRQLRAAAGVEVALREFRQTGHGAFPATPPTANARTPSWPGPPPSPRPTRCPRWGEARDHPPPSARTPAGRCGVRGRGCGMIAD